MAFSYGPSYITHRFTYERRCLASPTILRREGEDTNSILENHSEMVMNLTDIGVDQDMT